MSLTQLTVVPSTPKAMVAEADGSDFPCRGPRCVSAWRNHGYRYRSYLYPKDSTLNGVEFLPSVNFGARVDSKQICRHARKGIRAGSKNNFSWSIWGVVMNEPRILSSHGQRTRRNIMKMGAILGAVALMKIEQARAVVSPSSVPRSNCLLRGTNIQTTTGQRKIEDLAIGDLLPTVFGGIRPIQWIGRYPIKKSNPAKPWVKDALPVRIARSAVAPGVPHSTLYVTAAHALFIDGLLVPAGILINDTTIKRYEAREYPELEFFHIKLESHDVIYAEGAPVETLLNIDECAVNFAEYFRRHGAPKTEETPCAPRVSSGGRAELKSRFRSAMSPWLDRRDEFDVIRERLEERGIVLSRNRELAY